MNPGTTLVKRLPNIQGMPMGYLIFCTILVLLATAMLLTPSHTSGITTAQRNAALGGVAAMIVVLTLVRGYTTVPPGNLGVIDVFGRLEPTPLKPGLHFVRPWANVILQETRLLIYPAPNRKFEYTAISIDQQPVRIEMTVTYLRSDVVEAIRNISSRQNVVEEIVVVPATNEILKEVVSGYKVSEVLEMRDRIRSQVEEKLSEWFARYHLSVKEVSIDNVSFSKGYERAIEEKQQEKVRADQAEYELKLADTKAQEAKVVATGKANATIAQAKGEASKIRFQAEAKAESIRMRGAADAEAARLVSDAYTPTVHTRNVLSKWDGSPPSVSVAPGETVPMMLPVPFHQLTPQTPPEK